MGHRVKGFAIAASIEAVARAAQTLPDDHSIRQTGQSARR